MYNVAKIARMDLLPYFPPIFDGLVKVGFLDNYGIPIWYPLEIIVLSHVVAKYFSTSNQKLEQKVDINSYCVVTLYALHSLMLFWFL